MTAPWITHRAGRRPAPVATASPRGIGPSATASRSISSPPARLSAPATPAPIQRWSLAAFATASTASPDVALDDLEQQEARPAGTTSPVTVYLASECGLRSSCSPYW